MEDKLNVLAYVGLIVEGFWDDNCNIYSLYGNARIYQPTGCINYDDGSSQMIECTSSSMTNTYYNGANCNATAVGSIVYENGECDENAMYTIETCDGNNSAIEITFGVAFAFIVLIQLLK